MSAAEKANTHFSQFFITRSSDDRENSSSSRRRARVSSGDEENSLPFRQSTQTHHLCDQMAVLIGVIPTHLRGTDPSLAPKRWCYRNAREDRSQNGTEIAMLRLGNDGPLHRFSARPSRLQFVSNLIAFATNWPSPIIAGVTSLPTLAARE
ncbi:MAG: hypothetical protein WBW73_20095 [Rhodoplanes sp.]